ncbi:MAG TPA: PAS domain-containing protein [Paludibacteraceae bacterium]|nr:PAS domain-containing protein [Paludibacteraceae bacterium]
MSEFSTHQINRLADLNILFDAITYKKQPAEAIKKYQHTIDNTIPDDVVILVHKLMESSYPMEDIKSGINKLLNVLRRSLDSHPYTAPAYDTFFDICIRNNNEVKNRLNKLRPFILQINKQGVTEHILTEMLRLWKEVQEFTQYYVIKENVLFPLVEKYLFEYRCIAVMWSIHDDIRRNLNDLTDLLASGQLDLQKLNRLTGEVFYNIYSIAFREERLLYPFIAKNVPASEIEKLWDESVEIGFPYFNPQKKIAEPSVKNVSSGLVDLKSGALSAEQLILIFSHLPVDITYVDENNKVCFYSTPKKRIFTRTNAILGRDVRNCHPHESVHVVEQIVESFRNGTKDKADFWINMKGKKILIQYFAVRNERNEYKGVIEVTQEISEIQALEGERRILDWHQ